MSAVITALRAATGDAHRALEAELDPEWLCASRDRYARFLAALYGFHAAAETALAELAVPGLRAAPSRAALLAADLRVQGVDAGDVPVMPAFLEGRGDAPRYGLLYVVEGSALGGTVLARMVRTSLEIGPADGAAFFGAAAKDPGRWREVKAVLERELAGAELDAAARAATEAFRSLAAWMRTCGVVRAPS